MSMQVYILDPDYNLLGVIDEAESILWNPKYNDVGECEIYIPCTEEYVSLLRRGNYVYRFDEDMFCKIEDFEIQTDVENGDYIIATAKDICNILAGRIVRWQIVFSGTLGEFIKKVLNDNVINTEQSHRAISHFIFDDENTDEIDINIETDINTIGYRFEISNDKYFKHIIYSYDQPINLYVNDGSPIIDNFQFIIPRLFTSWDNIPELLVIRTIFIDKLTTTVMYSNPLVISHEMYKYLINDEKINRISSLISRQTKIDTENMNLDNFNFIDKINCVVVKDNADKTNIGSINNTPKILYKPIFYKAYQLQNVKIKSSLIQNVGINLADLLTKVETFKLVINGIQHIEIGRNDVYVIFNIDANRLGGQSGSYIITNQDDEYISDGLWTIS
jgi:hypothetical protein